MNVVDTIKFFNAKALAILRKHQVIQTNLVVHANTQVKGHSFYLIKASVKENGFCFSGIGKTKEQALEAFERNIQQNLRQISFCPPLMKSLQSLPQN